MAASASVLMAAWACMASSACCAALPARAIKVALTETALAAPPSRMRSLATPASSSALRLSPTAPRAAAAATRRGSVSTTATSPAAARNGWIRNRSPAAAPPDTTTSRPSKTNGSAAVPLPASDTGAPVATLRKA